MPTLGRGSLLWGHIPTQATNMSASPVWHVTKGHVAEEREGLSQPRVIFLFGGGYLMASSVRHLFFTFYSTLFLSPSAAPASRHLRFPGIYSPRDRLV